MHWTSSLISYLSTTRVVIVKKIATFLLAQFVEKESNVTLFNTNSLPVNLLTKPKTTESSQVPTSIVPVPLIAPSPPPYPLQA